SRNNNNEDMLMPTQPITVTRQDASDFSKTGRPPRPPSLDSQSIGLRRLCFCRIGPCLKCLYLCLRLTLRSITFLFRPLQLSLDFRIALFNLLFEFRLPVRMNLSVLCLKLSEIGLHGGNILIVNFVPYLGKGASMTIPDDRLP